MRGRRRHPTVLLLALLLAGCSAGTADWFPLEAGLRWAYALERTTMDGRSRQWYFVENLPGEPVAGRTLATPRRTFAGNLYWYARDAGGLWRVATRRAEADDIQTEEPPALVLPEPLAPGLRWQQTVRTQVLEKTGPPQETLFRIVVPVQMDYGVEAVDAAVVVPAGRYTGCLRVVGRGTTTANVGNYVGQTQISVESEDVYAPGVGLVSSVRRERTSHPALDAGELRLVLTSLLRP